MPTRREVLLGGLALPTFALPAFAKPRVEDRISIQPQDDCLSAESAAGYRTFFTGPRGVSARPIVILPAYRSFTRERALTLRKQAAAGALVLFESASFAASSRERQDLSQTLRDVFAVELLEPVLLPAGEWAGDYVRFTHPCAGHVRTFCAVSHVRAAGSTVLAEWNGRSVAASQPIGHGAFVALGSLLGPALLARDPEALQIAQALLVPAE